MDFKFKLNVSQLRKMSKELKKLTVIQESRANILNVFSNQTKLPLTSLQNMRHFTSSTLNL